MSEEIEHDFNLASNYIQSHHDQFNKDILLQFYGFYKQATVGAMDNKQERPSFFKLQERAKYDSWKSLGTMSQEQAMTSYVELLSKLVTDWICDVKDNRQKGSSGSFGFSVSRPQAQDLISESEKVVQDYVKDGEVEKLKEILSTISSSELNSLDDDGLGLIHWAADRGNQDVLKILLDTNDINIDLQDIDGQTASFYASSIGHYNCLKLLIERGADKNIKDSEGNKCIDVAYDDMIRKVLS